MADISTAYEKERLKAGGAPFVVPSSLTPPILGREVEGVQRTTAGKQVLSAAVRTALAETIRAASPDATADTGAAERARYAH